MIAKIKNGKDNLRKTVKRMSEKDKRNLFRLDSKLLTLWHEASEKGRLEIIITVVVGFIVGIFIVLTMLR